MRQMRSIILIWINILENNVKKIVYIKN